MTEPEPLDGLTVNRGHSIPRGIHISWTPHPVKVTVRDNGDFICGLLNSHDTTITGWGPLKMYRTISY